MVRESMTKHEFELKKAILGARRFELVMGFLTHIATLCAVLGSIYLIMEGIRPLIGQSPEAISAFTGLIKAINLPTIIGYVVATLTSIGWYLERKGKQRAIKEKSHYQKLAEKDDLHHPSSGLTEIGGTPKEE
jgi:hypothetical protein